MFIEHLRGGEGKAADQLPAFADAAGDGAGQGDDGGCVAATKEGLLQHLRTEADELRGDGEVARDKAFLLILLQKQKVFALLLALLVVVVALPCLQLLHCFLVAAEADDGEVRHPVHGLALLLLDELPRRTLFLHPVHLGEGDGQ